MMPMFRTLSRGTKRLPLLSALCAVACATLPAYHSLRVTSGSGRTLCSPPPCGSGLLFSSCCPGAVVGIHDLVRNALNHAVFPPLPAVCDQPAHRQSI